jgi:hypothetical protein
MVLVGNKKQQRNSFMSSQTSAPLAVALMASPPLLLAAAHRPSWSFHPFHGYHEGVQGPSHGSCDNVGGPLWPFHPSHGPRGVYSRHHFSTSLTVTSRGTHAPITSLKTLPIAVVTADFSLSRPPPPPFHSPCHHCLTTITLLAATTLVSWSLMDPCHHCLTAITHCRYH